MKTYNQIKEVIRDICSPCGVLEIKNANKQVKRFIGYQFVGAVKMEDQLCTIVHYRFIDENGDSCTVSWDFWNRCFA